MESFQQPFYQRARFSSSLPTFFKLYPHKKELISCSYSGSVITKTKPRIFHRNCLPKFSQNVFCCEDSSRKVTGHFSVNNWQAVQNVASSVRFLKMELTVDIE